MTALGLARWYGTQHKYAAGFHIAAAHSANNPEAGHIAAEIRELPAPDENANWNVVPLVIANAYKDRRHRLELPTISVRRWSHQIGFQSVTVGKAVWGLGAA